MKRRNFLMFMGVGAGSIALQPLVQNGQKFSASLEGASALAADAPSGLGFNPIKGPMPLEIYNISSGEQKMAFSSYAIQDDVVLPEGFTYDVVASWGEPVGNSRFGYNNDYLSLVETAPNEGYLVVNHEYISSKPWIQTYQEVVGKSLPFDEVKAAVEAAGDEGINAFALPNGDPIKAQISEVSKEALVDLGVSVISVRREANGRWVRTNSNRDRRITGVSGLDDGHYLGTTGPATSVFTKTMGQGYIDGLGSKIIGTFNNCSGGTTPWGTVLSAEENFQDFVPEPVHADGTSFAPDRKTFFIDGESVGGLGNAFGLSGNKYGWMVEVDPANPNDYGTKHTWLGRFRHEAVAVRAEAGMQLAVYSGCDRRSGHVYKFVSAGTVGEPTSKTNSRLFADGTLYAAKFNPDGTGQWIPLAASTPVNPDAPSDHVGGMITLPNRPDGGVQKVTDDAVAAAFKSRYATLGDLYTGSDRQKQGAILIDAHYAANAAGATCTARPEDTDISADGTLYITFTSGSPSGSDGGPNKNIFKGPNGETPYEYGWIVKLVDAGRNPAAQSFTWEILATGGEPADGGLGFANPDNLEIDTRGNVWMVTDMSSDKHNKAIPSRIKSDGSPVSQSDLRGLYGNNSLWYIPTSGQNAGEAYLFAFGPMDSEMTGPFFSKDQKTLFLSAQHPGEVGGRRTDMAKESRQYAMKTTTGEEFMQTRDVPLGSNWPGKNVNDPPKPSVIAVRRLDGNSLTGA
ncbi:MAG TPA: alkaline phosphatase PhoX [Chroococcidiopsis sp.]